MRSLGLPARRPAAAGITQKSQPMPYPTAPRRINPSNGRQPLGMTQGFNASVLLEAIPPGDVAALANSAGGTRKRLSCAAVALVVVCPAVWMACSVGMAGAAVDSFTLKTPVLNIASWIFVAGIGFFPGVAERGSRATCGGAAALYAAQWPAVCKECQASAVDRAHFWARPRAPLQGPVQKRPRPTLPL